MSRYIRFWVDMLTFTARGSRTYYYWCAALLLLFFVGLYGYSQQAIHGMIVTNLSDQVAWGAYIANFTYLVGVSDAAVLLVIPAYLHRHREIKEVVLLGMMLAIAAILMSLLFIVVDLGRPDRFLHILPFVGRLNFPQSVLAWDVVFLNGYLLLSLHIPGYLLYMKYLGKEPERRYYLPFILLSILWAVSVHTVTAFLYSGLGGRPYWNGAILAPRFLVSSFACGSAILILMLTVVNRISRIETLGTVFKYLRRVLIYTLIINLFLLACELFKEFYTDSTHVASARYLFFGLYGHGILIPYIWGAISIEIAALFIFILNAARDHEPRLGKRNDKAILVGCVFVAVGIWVEKGMGLIVPGFIPSPLGDIVEYTPSAAEIMVCVGIWAFGGLVFTLLAKVALGILTGQLRYHRTGRST